MIGEISLGKAVAKYFSGYSSFIRQDMEGHKPTITGTTRYAGVGFSLMYDALAKLARFSIFAEDPNARNTVTDYIRVLQPVFGKLTGVSVTCDPSTQTLTATRRVFNQSDLHALVNAAQFAVRFPLGTQTESHH